MATHSRFFWDYFTKLQFDYVIAQVSRNSGAKICDIGCGNGQLSEILAWNGYQVMGLDTKPSNIWQMRTMNQPQGHCLYFYVARAEMLPFVNHTFDCVVCNCALEHFENDDIALNEMSRVLVTKGLLVMTVDSMTYRQEKPDFFNKHRIRHNIRHLYSSTILQDKLIASGFKVIDLRYQINSPISAFLYRIGSTIGYRSTLLWILTFLLSPLINLSDRVINNPNGGYQIAVTASKQF